MGRSPWTATGRPRPAYPNIISVSGEALARRQSMQHGVTKSMKTAISVDDVLMQQADEAARDLGLSRSALVADALREYLSQRRRARISEQLNQAYSNAPSPDERRLVRRLKTKLLVPDKL